MKLISPDKLKSQYPLRSSHFIEIARAQAAAILQRSDSRLAVILGPCSIHDPSAALEYAEKLKNLAAAVGHRFFLVMRVFVEKPRTQLGWKGFLYDPLLDGSYDIELGLQKSRELMLKIIEMGVPIAAELLDPILAPYFDDLLVWGLVGARTSASQPHRQMASNLHFPIGFKNDCQGRIDEALAAILSSQSSHDYVGINEMGEIAKLTSKGNPHSHLVLRGSTSEPNYDALSVENALRLLEQSRLPARILIDCSHGNCGKDHRRQAHVFESVIAQAASNPCIAGLLLESHLFEGKQTLGEDPSLLEYGVSITDPCMSWQETQDLLLSTSISSVQN